MKHSSNLTQTGLFIYFTTNFKNSFNTTSLCYILVYGPAFQSSPRKRKRTDIKEDDSSAEEDENILDYLTDSSCNNDDGNDVIDNGNLNIEKVVWDGPGISYSLYSGVVVKFCL